MLGLGTRLNFPLLHLKIGVPLALQSPLPFPSPFEFRCGEPSEKVPGRPFPMLLSNGHWPFVGPTDAVSTLRVLYFWHVSCLFLSLSI